MNRKAVRRSQAETETSRHCSFAGDKDTGVILHSAKKRSTSFLAPHGAKQFLAKWYGTNSAEARDRLVESYF